MYIHAIVSPRDVRVMNGSMQSSSRCVNCHSASSVSSSFFFTTPSALMSSMIAYVGGGGMKANLAAIRAGHGGQQNMPQSRLTAFQVMLLPPPLILSRDFRLFTTRNSVNNKTVVDVVVENFTAAFSPFNGTTNEARSNSSINNSNAI